MSMFESEDLKEKEYRHGMVAAQIEIDLPFQIRALRKQCGLTQPQLAELTGMKQPRISAMEKPGGAHFTLETLKRLAEAFDVALVVRFAPFSELLDWSRNFNPESFQVANFALECETECRSLTTKGNGSGSLLESIVDPVSQSKQNVVSIVDSDRYRANYEGWPVENVREGSQTAKGPAVEQATWGQDQGRRGSLCRS